MTNCICKGNLVYGYKNRTTGTKNSYYYLLLMTGRHDQLAKALLSDMERCPVHYPKTMIKA